MASSREARAKANRGTESQPISTTGFPCSRFFAASNIILYYRRRRPYSRLLQLNASPRPTQQHTHITNHASPVPRSRLCAQAPHGAHSPNPRRSPAARASSPGQHRRSASRKPARSPASPAGRARLQRWQRSLRPDGQHRRVSLFPIYLATPTLLANTSPQRCRSRLLDRPRRGRLVQRRLERARRAGRPARGSGGQRRHGDELAVPAAGGLRAGRQQLPLLHGPEPGRPDHLRLVFGSAEGLPGCG